MVAELCFVVPENCRHFFFLFVFSSSILAGLQLSSSVAVELKSKKVEGDNWNFSIRPGAFSMNPIFDGPKGFGNTTYTVDSIYETSWIILQNDIVLISSLKKWR